MNFQAMATFVRAQAETDSSDAPDLTLEVYARAAYNDIQARVHPWPDKKVTYVLLTQEGQSSYDLSSLTGGIDMQLVVSVASSTDVLHYISPEQYREWSLSGVGGVPSCYAVVDGSIMLWPAPAAQMTLNVSGYRAFALWPSGSNEPDVPRGFDEAICWYMLARFYQAQEDLGMSESFMQAYEGAVNQQLASALRTSSVSAGPRIFGGGGGYRMSYSDWVKRSVEG